MSDWRSLTPADAMPPGTAREFVAGGRIVALFRVGDDFYALDGLCPHQGGPLGQGTLDGTVVTCPWHGFQFDVRTGRHARNPDFGHVSLPTRIEDGQVWVDLG